MKVYKAKKKGIIAIETNDNVYLLMLDGTVLKRINTDMFIRSSYRQMKSNEYDEERLLNIITKYDKKQKSLLNKINRNFWNIK